MGIRAPFVVSGLLDAQDWTPFEECYAKVVRARVSEARARHQQASPERQAETTTVAGIGYVGLINDMPLVQKISVIFDKLKPN